MAASGVSIDALLVAKKQVTEKIVDCLTVFLQEGEPGIFNRDAYDALEDTYSTPELKDFFCEGDRFLADVPLQHVWPGTGQIGFAGWCAGEV